MNKLQIGSIVFMNIMRRTILGTKEIRYVQDLILYKASTLILFSMGDNPGLKSLNNRLVSYIDKVDM